MTDDATAPADPSLLDADLLDHAVLDRAVDTLIAQFPPHDTDPAVFRGARFDAGLAWVHFPVGRGGRGGRIEHHRRVETRLAEMGAPPPGPGMFFGLALAGPTLLTHGSAEMLDRLLKPMYTGEQIWCQLFSEPGAGSDLASLATRAVRDGDEWIVNGQKVWNTGAHLADRGLLITRTDPDQPKHKGMTYFVVDMRQPGVEVRPLRQITGEAEFNEVYLTDARIPDRDRVGDVGDGWRVALTTLANERTAISTGTAARKASSGTGPVAELMHTMRLAPRDAIARDRAARLWSQAEVLRLTNQRAGAARAAGRNPGAEGSITKLAMANLVQAVYETCVDLMGAAGMIDYDFTFRRPDAVGFNLPLGSSRHLFLRSRASPIEGGSSEIQRNILGERVLGLPGEPRTDRDAPWSQVPR